MQPLCLNPRVLLTTTSEGYLAYDTAQNRLHELNPTAALLVELCDGRRTATEILELARPLLPVASDPAVMEWLGAATEQGLLINGPQSNDDNVNELTAEQLIDLASRLRDEGQVQAAFLCQQRACEMVPDQAEQLYSLGELAHIVGRRDVARTAYEQYLTHCSNDAEVRHLLTSLRDEEPPTRVPAECIRQLYRRFSGFYEVNMCDELDYAAPQQLGKVIDRALADQSELTVLDLGCGTGLSGRAVANRAKRLVGIDLSPEMVQLASETGLYEELHVAEVTEWLSSQTETFDLIIACDTLIYFGDLRQVLEPAARLLAPGGLFAFSVEESEQAPFRLTDSGRYEHHPDHIRLAAQTAELSILEISSGFLRMEYGREVHGLLTCLKKIPLPH